MTLLEQLQLYKGSLINIKSQLYWYTGSPRWDGISDRICLLLDVDAANDWTAGCRTAAITSGAFHEACRVTKRRSASAAAAYAYLLIDGSLRWILMDEEDVVAVNDVS